MMKFGWSVAVMSSMVLTEAITSFGVLAQQPLYLAYPPVNHKTTADRIFFVGAAATEGLVSINGQPIKRSLAGYFAPTFPLQVGDNRFTIRYKNQTIERNITRLSNQPNLPQTAAFAPNSLVPQSAIARLPGEEICFGAIAAPAARVSVTIGNQTLPLNLANQTQLPANSALLTARNQSTTLSEGQFQGCGHFDRPGSFGMPQFLVQLNGQQRQLPGAGTVEILSPEALPAVEVIAESGTARTGPSTDYSRLTPLPKGTVAQVTGRDGNWLRLDYGGWILQSETRSLALGQPTQSVIRSVSSRQREGVTEILFPLQVPVPVTVSQGDRTFTLTLHNTIAQTDTIRLDDDPLIKRLDWTPLLPKGVQYVFTLKTEQQWGYSLRYEGNTLILSLRHPPKFPRQDLQGARILIDPGHGGNELGSSGPNGYPEKAVNLRVSQLLAQQLGQRGATVYLTRESDRDLSLQERVALIDRLQPTLSISIHYNALPDGGNAEQTQGISAFWYQPQAHDLAVFLEDYLVKKLNRPSYGVFWNNLALTRPSSAPSILLELGFMINPQEFEWVIDGQSQQRLAQTLAQGISDWLQAKASNQN
jgi:N-acetylmuramoyl-L-alanine amidase